MAGAKKKGPVRKRATKNMRTGGMMPMQKLSRGGKPGAKRKAR